MFCLEYHPIELDHPLGWRVSDWTMPLCLNCHQKKTAVTLKATSALAQVFENINQEERHLLRTIFAIIEFEYLILVCTNIASRIGYLSR